MSIRKRVKAIFAKPERKLTVVKPELQQLRQTLQRASESRDSLTEIVHFFDTMSRWHDRGIGDLIAAFEEVNYGQYDEVLKKLRTLQEHFENAGRNSCGMNQTIRNQRVTEDNVFLGDVWGLWTKPVRFWKTYKDQPEKTAANDRPVYDVISQQARQFMASHTGPMIIILNNLEAVAA